MFGQRAFFYGGEVYPCWALFRADIFNAKATTGSSITLQNKDNANFVIASEFKTRLPVNSRRVDGVFLLLLLELGVEDGGGGVEAEGRGGGQQQLTLQALAVRLRPVVAVVRHRRQIVQERLAAAAVNTGFTVVTNQGCSSAHARTRVYVHVCTQR